VSHQIGPHLPAGWDHVDDTVRKTGLGDGFGENHRV
jgi:hypothetical protein